MNQNIIPTETECIEILKEAGAKPLLNHSQRVKKIALAVSKKLISQGIEIDIPLIIASALLHDITKLSATICHMKEGGELLRSKGLDKIAKIVERHGLTSINDPEFTPSTYEEKIIFYSDLRANPGKIVSLKERFEYIKNAYPHIGPKIQTYYEFAKKIELELLGKEPNLEL
ncbi:HDIG domain-containing protein [Candidatus Woesearchaeota archaeon]|jgi:uncharacterized protein|nr:HDIG domain-containing protein [Candidatus Woesearchaeota archaeon]